MAKHNLPVRAAVPSMEMVSGNPDRLPSGVKASVSMPFRPGVKVSTANDRRIIAKDWQRRVYRHMNICGEARFAVVLFANIAARAELGISEPNSLGRKAVWINTGPEVDVLAELCPTISDRKKMIRDFMTHWVSAGECYLIARARIETDPGYGVITTPVWEIVAVTELQRINNDVWQVRHDNDTWLTLAGDDPVIRMWNPDPENRREAWSPLRSMLSTLDEIEYLTKHIFTQVRSRLISAGIWFVPENITFPEPPPESVEGGAEALAMMSEAEKFMVSIAASSMQMLEAEEVAFPTIVMADDAALQQVSQDKLIKFWAEIDDKAMKLRSDAIRRFALGWDMPPEQTLGASGIAVSGGGGSAGSVNHWGVWANQEETISNHVEPALDNFVRVLTLAVVQVAVAGSTKVVGYDTASLRLRQDRSKESIQLFDRGELKGEVMLRENGFDPEFDRMDDAEFRRWLLTKIAGGSATPEQVNESLRLLGVVLNVDFESTKSTAPEQPGRNQPPNLDRIRPQGPPTEQHDHSDAPFTALVASCEGLVLRALEKGGNRLLNEGKRGRDRDRTTPPHLAHLSITPESGADNFPFDFSTLSLVLDDRRATEQAKIGGAMLRYCRQIYRDGEPYSRDDLINVLKGL